MIIMRKTAALLLMGLVGCNTDSSVPQKKTYQALLEMKKKPSKEAKHQFRPEEGISMSNAALEKWLDSLKIQMQQDNLETPSKKEQIQILMDNGWVIKTKGGYLVYRGLLQR